MKLSLTVVDTPGYGDRLDNTGCWDPALRYLHTQVSGVRSPSLYAQSVDFLLVICCY